MRYSFVELLCSSARNRRERGRLPDGGVADRDRDSGKGGVVTGSETERLSHVDGDKGLPEAELSCASLPYKGSRSIRFKRHDA